jgi:hypothetical protein
MECGEIPRAARSCRLLRPPSPCLTGTPSRVRPSECGGLSFPSRSGAGGVCVCAHHVRVDGCMWVGTYVRACVHACARECGRAGACMWVRGVRAAFMCHGGFALAVSGATLNTAREAQPDVQPYQEPLLMARVRYKKSNSTQYGHPSRCDIGALLVSDQCEQIRRRPKGLQTLAWQRSPKPRYACT